MLVGYVSLQVQGVFSKSILRALLLNSARRRSSNVVLSVDGFKHLAKNVSASCSVPSVSGDELKCKTIEAFSGLRIAFIAANLVDILLVASVTPS